jgi:hypothetical protein
LRVVRIVQADIPEWYSIFHEFQGKVSHGGEEQRCPLPMAWNMFGFLTHFRHENGIAGRIQSRQYRGFFIQLIAQHDEHVSDRGFRMFQCLNTGYERRLGGGFHPLILSGFVGETEGRWTDDRSLREEADCFQP